MIKLNSKYQSRGWQALKIKLEKKGLAPVEIQEAEESFYQGVTVLSELFLSKGVENSLKKRRLKKRIV